MNCENCPKRDTNECHSFKYVSNENRLGYFKGNIECTYLKTLLKDYDTQKTLPQERVTENTTREGLFREHRIKNYVNPKVYKQIANYNRFKKIAKKRVSDSEERKTKEYLYDMFWNSDTGISTILQKGYSVGNLNIVGGSKKFRVINFDKMNPEFLLRTNFFEEETFAKRENSERRFNSILKIANLTDKQKEAFLTDKVFSNKAVDLANKWGVSEPAITKLKQKAKIKIKQALGG